MSFESLGVPEINLEKIRTSILDDRADLYYGGRSEGNFKPASPGFSDRLEALRKKLGLEFIFTPKLQFTKRTASITDSAETAQLLGEGVLRTVEAADGSIIFFDEVERLGYKPSDIALAGFNADCPFVIGYEEDKRALFMLHAGLGCLRKVGEGHGPTIFDQLIKDYKLNPKKIKIQVTAGIQKCCYGRDDGKVFPDAIRHWGVQFGDVATDGPRKGQPSLNLAAAIFGRLMAAGIKSENIEVDAHCTCHDGQHWSNVKGDDARNLVLVRPSDKL